MTNLHYMKLFSFDSLFSSIKSTYSRFPLTIVCVYIATLITMWYTENIFSNEKVTKLVYTTLIGGLYFLSARIATEAYKITKKQKLILYFIVFGIVISYYLIIPPKMEEASRCFLWISLGLVLIGHLLVSIIPYILSKNSTLSFRSYNYQLLLRFGQAVFYTLVLYSTLSLALVSVESLFDIEIKSKTYARLFIFLAGIFNTTYFLSQFPNNFNEESYGQPKGLKVLAEYIMIPVLIIYTLILYAYILKVISNGTGPVSEVRYMIIAFLIFGVFTYLINYFKESENRNYISSYFSKLFFPVAAPVSILLLIAVWQESQQTGITDELYIHGIIAIWSIVLTVYMVASKRDDIKWVPLSLICVSVIAFFTPFIGICDLTVNSHFEKVKKLMISHDLLINNTISKPAINSRIHSPILRDGLRYLDDYNKLDLILQYDKLKVLDDSIITYNTIYKKLNIAYSNPRQKNTENIKHKITINNSRASPIDIAQYDEFIYFVRGSKIGHKYAQLNSENNGIQIKEGRGNVIHRYNLTDHIDSLKYDTKYIDLEDENSEVRFIIHYLNGDTDKNTITSLHGILLYRNKNK